ncbi:Periplasmic protein TonB [Marinobacterium lacunae]|uniref:Periplasmic protein TonB n=1 Tax=Marinobacterium lacunae TaxID=1232683 RepID=A0A081G0V2_9GAMM|nr:hypothetical protein [Marinobacterium lacunae]KEA64407.1 Periplasmic protein TonB [Marinobacterium lacunae]MBR9882347.1 hypothetical protein [Oceanospirillales bacterium]
MMNLSGEQLRHQYLEAIGISSWLPRTSLPGAAPSQPWVERFRYPMPEGMDEFPGFDETDDVSPAPETPDAVIASERPTESAETARAQARASIAPLIESDTRAKAPPAQSVPVGAVPESASPAPAVRRGPPAQAPRVKLAFVLAGDLLIVDSLPPAARQGFSGQHQRLLAGIARALGVGDQPSDASLLSWPVLAGTTLDQGPEELKRAVRRKLEITLQLRRVTRALFLGESAAQWMLEREETLDALRGIRFSLRPELHCVASVSLSQLLQLPTLKAELWRDLQPLLVKSS